jgi:hypothetical protein
MSSTPRRNSPIEIADGKTGSPDAAAFTRKPFTPRFAFAPFRASLTTFGSIRYNRRAFARTDAFEVGVDADGGIDAELGPERDGAGG